MNIIVKNIPNSITCLNIAAGCMAILCALKGESGLWGLTGLDWAYIFVGIAAIADFLDGFAARILHAYSDLGKELDSLCDAVSFGVAPAIIMYATLSDTVAYEWLKWTVILIPVAGVLRLAKFNIDTRQTTSFIGLPIPANAIFWIGYSAICREGSILSTEWYFFLPVLLFECWLMVSPLKLFSLKFKRWGWRGNEYRWILILTAILLLCFCGVTGLMWLIIAYLVIGLIAK